MIKCISNKRAYDTAAMAEDALLDAHANFQFRKGQGPVAVYQCEDCGYFHLTSKGAMNPRLAQSISTGTLNREKTAKQWLDKIKRK